MSLNYYSRGPARAAPAVFPYPDHGTLEDVWAGRGTMALTPPAESERRWCEQCQKRVTKSAADRCHRPFCKGGAA